eukprot:jgi/Tetstr1/439523/TSEL_027952.t1
MPASSRKYASLLPPFWERETTVERFCDGVWMFRQPMDLGAGDVGMRMTVVKLRDGTLWVHSPVALTDECRTALRSLGGRVSHVVVPSLSPQHWIFAAVYARYFPGATIWVPPGLLEMRERMRLLENIGVPELAELADARPRVLGAVSPPAWRQDIGTALFSCPMWVEAAFCVLDHGVLLTSDLCFEADSDPRARSFLDRLRSLPLQAMLVVGRMGGPLAYPIFNLNKEAALAWVMQITEMNFYAAIPGHFDAPIYDGKRKFIECFEYVLKWDTRGSSYGSDDF